MQWSDEGIVLGARRHGETSAIVELMTREHGRHLGLVRGGAGTRMRPILQAGNSVGVVWRARLDEHLGYYTVEGLRLRAASFLSVPHAVYGVTHLAALLRLLPERDPHADIYENFTMLLDVLDDARAVAPLIARFELQLLREFGFGLDLERCAATGATQELVYVSPKSGRAVSRSASVGWEDKLLRLPAFLHEDHATPGAEDLADAFALTGLFLARHVLEPRGVSSAESRDRFVAAVLRASA
jgi:DNA repair protein RecO (recombination protein O)